MVAQPTPSEGPFEDYYYVLNVRPDAPAAEIEQAYWRLVRSGGATKVDMDEVNHAYGVLTSPEHRHSYDQLRNAVLGQGAPPQPPQLEDRRARPPLTVMEKQHPRPRLRMSQNTHEPRLLGGWWGRMLAALVLMALVAGVTLIIFAQMV